VCGEDRVDRLAKSRAPELAGDERRRERVEGVGQRRIDAEGDGHIGVAVPVDDGDVAALSREQPSQRGGDGGLAGAALAGDGNAYGAQARGSIELAWMMLS
jgi:hypothetical protein